MNVYGEQKTDIERYIATEAQASLFFARKKHPELEAGDELPTTVVIRADKATPFRLLNTIISTCQNHGYRKFSLKAMNKEQEQ